MRLPKMLGPVWKVVRPVVATLKNWAWKLLPYMPDRVTQEQWEALYSSRHLDYYKDIGELARYSVIVGYCAYFKPSGALLDLGCGTGILQERLHPNTYAYYLGVDLSKEAISQASSRQDAKTFFEVADVSVYVPDKKFDVIIFNECLFHFDNPMSVVRKYENFLNDHGLFLISICDHERTCELQEKLQIYKRRCKYYKRGCKYRSDRRWIGAVVHT